VTKTGKVRIKSNVSAATLAQSVKTASIVGTVKDDDGIDIPLSAVVLVDPTQNPALIGGCGMYITSPAGTSNLIMKRALTAAAGTTAVWTPTSGKRFRLLGYSWSIPNTATSAAGSAAGLLDQAAGIAYLSEIGTTTTGANNSVSLGVSGYPSAAVNNILYINLTAAFTAGEILITVWGTEE
jgi:hypothetical protein